MQMFATIGPLQIAGIAIAGTALTSLLLFLLLREQKSILASDGTRFSSESARNAYEEILSDITNLYLETTNKSASNDKFGISKEFLKLLKEQGFQETKTLIKFRSDFVKLAKLFEGRETAK